MLLKIDLSDGSRITTEWTVSLDEALKVLTGGKFVVVRDDRGVTHHVNPTQVVSVQVV